MAANPHSAPRAPGQPDPSGFTFFGRAADDPQAWADARRLEGDALAPGQFEWWYADGHLSNGVTFVASYHLEVGAGGGLETYVTFNLADEAGVVADRKIPADPETAAFARESCDVRVGGHYLRSLEGLNRYEIFVDPGRNDGNGLHLLLNRRAPSYAPGPDAGVNPPGPYFRWVCAVPSGELTGTVTVRGETYEVSGSGYHDHNWGNVPMGALARDWHWARGQAGEYTAVAASVRFKNGVTLNNVFVADGDEVVIAAAGPGVSFLEGGPTAQPDTGKAINGDVAFFVGGAASGLVRFRGAETLASFIFDRDDAFNWWYTRFGAELEVEAEREGRRLRRSGRAILEHMDFRGEPVGEGEAERG